MKCHRKKRWGKVNRVLFYEKYAGTAVGTAIKSVFRCEWSDESHKSASEVKRNVL